MHIYIHDIIHTTFFDQDLNSTLNSQDIKSVTERIQ